MIDDQSYRSQKPAPRSENWHDDYLEMRDTPKKKEYFPHLKTREAEDMNESSELDTTIDEWREALEVRDDPGQSIAEISNATGIAESTLRRKIKQLIKEGKCIKGTAIREYPNMERGRYNVYQLTGEEE